MREASGTNEEPKRFEVFLTTSTNRKRKEPDEAIQHAIEACECRQASGETEKEAFQSLFGKEQPGRVRCYGRSITQADLRMHAEVSAIKQQHQEEVSALQSKLGAVQTQQQQQATQQQQQAEEIHGLRKMIKLLLLRSEPDMRPEEVEALLQDAQHSPIDIYHCATILTRCSWFNSCSKHGY
ncbi:hypothetical protein PIB30_073666, partial [Stylosanthes scabra]|nr:hypothetical protein [Stylosanthes scabra]